MSALNRRRDANASSSAQSIIFGVAAALAASAAFNTAAARRAETVNAPRGRFVDIDGALLHLLDTGGSGTPVVLLHGNGATSADMEVSGLIGRLRIEHRVLAFDRPGYGHSTRPRGTDWTPEAQADLIAASFDRLGIDTCVVLGHSWGALVAAALALRHPSRVRKLVLVSGYFYPTIRADVMLTSPAAIPILGDVMRQTVTPLLARLMTRHMIKMMFAPRAVPDRFWREFPLELGFRPSQLRASQEETAMMVPAARRLSPLYASLTCPVSIVAGKEDGVADPGRQSIALHQHIPHSRLHIVPGFGHMVHYAQSDVVADEVRVLPDEGLQDTAVEGPAVVAGST